MSEHPGRPWLAAAGALSGAVAALHAAIIAVGPPGYIYFGAPQLAGPAAAGSPKPALITSALVLVFALWSWYALAGAGVVRPRPPLLRLGLWTIGAIYTARGLLLGPELWALWRGAAPWPPRYAVFSLVSLAIGLAYLGGAWRSRPARGAAR